MSETHSFAPLIDEGSRVIILGSFPSIVSMRENFYYMHPSNHFWKIMRTLFNQECLTVEEKKACLLGHNIALFDLFQSVKRSKNNSSDTNLASAVVNDFEKLFTRYPSIHTVFCNGKKSYDGYCKAFGHLQQEVQLLPSSSAANASMKFEQKVQAYRAIVKALHLND